MRSRRIIFLSLGLLALGIFVLIAQNAVAEMNDWESALAKMQKGAAQMIEGAKVLRDKKDLDAAEKTIKDGHRIMMQAEKATAQIQKETLKQGARLMMEGLQVLKTKNDSVEAEKLMAQGQKMILDGERMMTDTRPEKFMQGSRTMMRGLRMMQTQDMNTARKLVKDGQGLMMEAEKTKAD